MSQYNLNHSKPVETADRVIGCKRCGKPSALVGDKIPFDGLCPWCRAGDAPRVYEQYGRERTSDNPDEYTCLACGGSGFVRSK